MQKESCPRLETTNANLISAPSFRFLVLVKEIKKDKVYRVSLLTLYIIVVVAERMHGSAMYELVN